MEKKVLLKDLVDSGTHIRAEFTPKAVVSTNGKYQIGEFWDANKTIDVIVNNSHAQHDNIRELDEYTHSQVLRLDNIKVGRISASDVLNLTNSQINSLKVGDTVMKENNGKGHSYTVVYKKDDEMSLVYADHETVEEVYYEKVNGDWTYIQTDTFKPEDYYTKTQIDDKLDDILGVDANDITTLKNAIEDLNDSTGLLPTLNGKQDTLVSGTNIKTVFGQSILGSGNIDIQQMVLQNQAMPISWDKAHTMTELIADINADDTAVPGKIYLSTVHLTDLPGGMSQAELKVEVMGQQAGKKILVFSISSADVSPYRWEYTSYNMGDGPWRSWLPSTTTLFSGNYNDLTNKPTIPTVPIKFISTSNITALTTAQCESLSPGDVVIKETGNMKHTYVVSYKEAGVGMCLTYTDASTSETVSYDFDGTDWVYNSTDITSFASIISRIEALENTVNPQL